jgi:parvulin-like peptidyl-prolyl isomerase
MRYQAAVDANIHRDPDLSTRLYDYQRTLIAERYATELRQKATLVDPKAVQDYYEKNRSRYVQPAGAMIALIKTNTESEAQQALERLRKGDSFADVATSASIDEASAKNGGVVGMISDGDTSIPAVGKAPQIIKSLVAMQPRSISSIVSQNGSFFIFQVLRTTPARNITLDEARPQIEMTLRGANVDAANTGIDANLREKYDPEVALEGLQKFWQFAAGEPNRDNANTTTSTAVTHTTQTAALAQRGK